VLEPEHPQIHMQSGSHVRVHDLVTRRADVSAVSDADARGLLAAPGVTVTGAVVEACKPAADDGRDLILRVWNPDDRQRDVSVEVGGARSITQVRLDETPLAGPGVLRADGDELRVTLEPGAILTLRATPV
jgi:alpha-mannosidase